MEARSRKLFGRGPRSCRDASPPVPGSSRQCLRLPEGDQDNAGFSTGSRILPLLERFSMPDSTLLTISEAAAFCGTHKNTIRRWISTGALRAYRLGPRLIRVDAADLQAAARQIPAADVTQAVQR